MYFHFSLKYPLKTFFFFFLLRNSFLPRTFVVTFSDAIWNINCLWEIFCLLCDNSFRLCCWVKPLWVLRSLGRRCFFSFLFLKMGYEFRTFYRMGSKLDWGGFNKGLGEFRNFLKKGQNLRKEYLLKMSWVSSEGFLIEWYFEGVEGSFFQSRYLFYEKGQHFWFKRVKMEVKKYPECDVDGWESGN